MTYTQLMFLTSALYCFIAAFAIWRDYKGTAFMFTAAGLFCFMLACLMATFSP